MPNALLSHRNGCSRRLAATSRRSPAWSQYARIALVMGVCLVLTGATAQAGEPTARLVERVDVISTPASLRLEIVTTAPQAPDFGVFPLREPDRLVMDIPDFRWKPGFTAHLPSASSMVKQTRVGQFTSDPPITRVVLDLLVPARTLQYRTVSSSDDGTLRVEVLPGSGRAVGSQPALGGPSDRQPIASQVATRRQVVASAVAPERATKAEPASQRQGVKGLTAPRQPNAPKAEEPRAPPPAAPTRASGLGAQTAGGSRSAEATAAVADRPSSAPALGGHLALAAAGLLLLAVAGSVAFLVRRRARGALVESATRSHGASTEAGEGGMADQADLVRCRVVDGYLLLAPEDGEGAVSALTQASKAAVSEATIELTLAGAEAVCRAIPQEDEGSEVPSADVAALISSLSDESIAARKTAAQGLCDLASEGHSAALLPYLESRDPRTRAVVVGALGEGGAIECADALAALADDPDPSVRAAVMHALARFGESASERCGVARARLSDDDASVRAAALAAYAALSPRSEQVAQEILGLTNDPDPLVRQSAASVSLGLAQRGLTGPLLALLADFTRRAQALELLQQADDVVLRRLMIAARSAPSDTGQAAFDALSYVVSRQWTADDFEEELASPDPDVRLVGLEGLNMVGGPEAMREIARLLKEDPSPQVRNRAAEMLAGPEEWTGQEVSASAGRDTGSSDS